MKRLICSLLAALLAMFMLCSCAAAESELVLQSVSIENQMLRLIVKANNTNFLQPSNFQVQLDAQEVSATNLSALENSGLSTTHLFIVDTSAMSNNGGNRLDDMKATLSKLIANLPSGDNAAVVTPGMLASTVSLTEGSSVLNAVVDGLKFNRDLTGMDLAIREACSFLSSADNLNERLNVVILSNGENETLSSAVISELCDRMRSLRVSTYTIAYKKYKPDASALSSFSLLALRGKGGVALELDYIPQNKPADDAQINALISQIRQNESLFFVLDVPLSAEMNSFSSVTIRMQQGSMTYSDSLMLTDLERQQLVEQMPTPEPTPVPTSVPVPTPEPDPIDEILRFIQENAILIAGIAVIVVLLIVLIVVLAGKGKKKNADEAVSGDPNFDTNFSNEGKTMPGENGYQGATEAVTGIRFNMQPVTQGDIVVPNMPLLLDGSVQIGRREDQCRIVISFRNSDNDIRTVSRIHARLTLQGETILIENLSKNGTKVNNSPIDRPTVLQKNDIITLGAVSFRATWDKA